MSAQSDSKNAPQVVGVLLLYYQPFAAEATKRFVALLQSISTNYLLVIVENQQLQLNRNDFPDAHVIAGDNTLHEFSGWQTGLEYCRQRKLIPQSGILVFANDTFCHHNKFGPITTWCFSQTFRKLLKNPEEMTLAGEVHPTGGTFSIDGKHFSQWVSTYLFAMTVNLSEKFESLVMSKNMDRFFTGKANPDSFLIGPLNEALKRHLVNYLFGLHRSAKWYAAAELNNDNLARFVSKTKSILCEMHLSAVTTGLGGKLTPVFGSHFTQQARRLERLLPRYRKRS